MVIGLPSLNILCIHLCIPFIAEPRVDFVALIAHKQASLCMLPSVLDAAARYIFGYHTTTLYVIKTVTIFVYNYSVILEPKPLHLLYLLRAIVPCNVLIISYRKVFRLFNIWNLFSS